MPPVCHITYKDELNPQASIAEYGWSSRLGTAHLSPSLRLASDSGLLASRDSTGHRVEHLVTLPRLIGLALVFGSTANTCS